MRIAVIGLMALTALGSISVCQASQPQGWRPAKKMSVSPVPYTKVITNPLLLNKLEPAAGLDTQLINDGYVWCGAYEVAVPVANQSSTHQIWCRAVDYEVITAPSGEYFCIVNCVEE